ncbi:MAG: bifunctional precorrin-2 dehydrogenase/sirohydrochlorin ferrochelatase [Armatimonadetes bacterium]|nr:bifunctional precorrin-2 dehydrogenase/sirohydrochlorin ferrochelatase [Armatimonadota bacterium]
MGYYPIIIDLTDKPCLVIGGGGIAYRKAQALVDAGSRVKLISPEVDKRIEALKNVIVVRRVYQPGDLDGYALVFAATGNREVNSIIAHEAAEKGIPINVVDDPELCSFIVPAILRRGDLMIAVTTSGKGPALSKKIKNQLENIFGEEYAPYIALLGEMRERVKELYPTQTEREAAMNRVIDNSEVLDLLRDGRDQEARETALSCI